VQEIGAAEACRRRIHEGIEIVNELEMIRNNLLKSRRLKLGLTQPELAHETGVSQSAISRAELLKPITVDAQNRIATYFGAEPEDIFPSFLRPYPIGDIVTTVSVEGFTPDLEKKMMLPEVRQRLMMVLAAALTECELLTLRWRYGLSGCEPLTQGRVAELLGITTMTVLNRENRALKKLRDVSLRDRLQSCLDEVGSGVNRTSPHNLLVTHKGDNQYATVH
jgi:transcriptional regulator with XRE-family HTH domain